MITLKTIIVNAPAELREALDSLAGDKALIDRCAAFRPGTIETTTASAKHTLRALAKRWLFLNDEIGEHDKILRELTEAVAPTLLDGFGIGPDTAAEMLIVSGTTPNGCTLKQPSRSSAGPVRSLPDRVSRTGGIASTAVVTDKPTQRSIGPRSCGCVSTSRRSTTSPAGPLKACPSERSSDA